MKKKKKWLYILLIIILATPVIFLHVAFNGNPLSKYMATSKLKTYFSEKYPNDELRIEESFYNFKDSGYHFNIIKVGDPSGQKYDFAVTGFFGTTVQHDGIYYANLDERLMNKLVKQAEAELTKVLVGTDELVAIDINLEVLKGKYTEDPVWDKNFKPEKPMNIHISIDAKGVTEEKLLEIAKEIQQLFNNGQYDYANVNIDGNLYENEYKDWYVKYSISFQPDDVLELENIYIETE